MKLFLTGLFAITLCALGGYAYAPHLPALLIEGSPSTTWSPAGYYAQVAGAQTPHLDNSYWNEINPNIKKLLEDSETSVLAVLHNGKVRLKYISKPHIWQTRFNSFSMVKSLVGVLAFRAHADGHIISLSDPLAKYLPELKDEKLRSQPVHALLNMKSGIHFEADSLKTASGTLDKDPEQFIANPFGPMARLHMEGLEPLLPKLFSKAQYADKFNYQNINTALLGLIIERAVNQKISTLLERIIWKSAGANSAY